MLQFMRFCSFVSRFNSPKLFFYSSKRCNLSPPPRASSCYRSITHAQYSLSLSNYFAALLMKLYEIRSSAHSRPLSFLVLYRVWLKIISPYESHQLTLPPYPSKYYGVTGSAYDLLILRLKRSRLGKTWIEL